MHDSFDFFNWFYRTQKMTTKSLSDDIDNKHLATYLHSYSTLHNYMVTFACN